MTADQRAVRVRKARRSSRQDDRGQPARGSTERSDSVASTRYTAEAQGTAEFCKRPGNCMINLHDCGCDLPDGPYYPVEDLPAPGGAAQKETP
jgi:hypothetical protein